MQASSTSSVQDFPRARHGSSVSSSSEGNGQEVGVGRSGAGGGEARNNSTGGSIVGDDDGESASEMNEVGVGVAAGCDDTSDHSGEGVEDDVVSTISRGSLLVGGERRSTRLNFLHAPTAIIPTGGGSDGGSDGCGAGISNIESTGGGDGGGGEEGNEYELDAASTSGGDSRRIASDDGDSVRSTDGLIGSSFLNGYSEHGSAGEGGGRGRGDGWARMRGRGRAPRNHPRIRPTQERGASPPTSPVHRTLSLTTAADDSGLGGVKFVATPGERTGSLLDPFCSPLSENTALAGSEMTQAGDD